MRILVTHPLHEQLVNSDLGAEVLYRPDLVAVDATKLRHVVGETSPEAVLCADPEAETAVAIGRELLLVHRDQGEKDSDPLPENTDGLRVETVAGAPGELRADLEALAIAERHCAHRAARALDAHGISPGPPSGLTGARVTLVGAGIVNLMTALDLRENGAAVEVVEGSPDPRTRPDWRRLGCTHAGANARMFCYTEADNYNEKANVVYSDMDELFRRRVGEGGWLVTPAEELDSAERAWIRNFESLPRWRAEVFTGDIHGFNIASGSIWAEIRHRHPRLFDDVGFVPGVLRLYSQDEKVAAACILHGRLGSLRAALDREELCRRHPALREAVTAGEIAGGLEIEGFTLNIHDFVAKLLDELEQRGVRLRFDERISAFERAADGTVNGLVSTGGVTRAEHYVLSPGVYGGELLAGTRSEGKIQGILGLWMLLPDVEPRHRRSMKIHREGHVGEDSNVTLATDAEGRAILILGSGYGFIGSRALDMDSPEIERLFTALEKTARCFLPGAWRQSALLDAGRQERKACVRPFTSTGLGLFEVDSTAEGGRLVITNGHNTGGFTQAPVVAEAVVATLGGAAHSMQALYAPERGVGH